MPILGLGLLLLAVGMCTLWAVRLLRAGVRDANDLAAKLAIPSPRCAGDWPELRLEAVVVDPENDDRMLVVAYWPAHPESRSLLVLEVEESPKRAWRLLTDWRDEKTPVSPRACDGERLVLRRRRSSLAVSARVVRETTDPEPKRGHIRVTHVNGPPSSGGSR